MICEINWEGQRRVRPVPQASIDVVEPLLNSALALVTRRGRDWNVAIRPCINLHAPLDVGKGGTQSKPDRATGRFLLLLEKADQCCPRLPPLQHTVPAA